ncbi:MAG: DUF4114 domain-containing protein [Rivularia sp. (in: cyanobacteria)]|jgi:hypothetical protein
MGYGALEIGNNYLCFSDNIFGFEDLAQAGDRDFNDMIAKVDFSSISR